MLYVGITRAKEKLHITWSRFIDFKQSKGYHTQSNKTFTIHGEKYSKVGLSEFIQDIDLRSIKDNKIDILLCLVLFN